LAASLDAPRTSRPRWLPYAIAGGVLAVAIVLVVVFVIKPGGGSQTGLSAKTPAFDFRLVSATPILGADHTSGDPAAVAEKAGNDIKTVLDRMYSLAFLDPEVWHSGDYSAVFGFFDQGAAANTAKADASTLTLGENAGGRFTTVTPASGILAVKVLVDKGGTPVSAIAAVDFEAKATGKNGPSDMVVSKGQYFLHILEGGWTILGYSVSRDDHPLGSGPAPSGSAT
jgi:hypothetical protein